MSSREERENHSYGKDRKMYCRICMNDQKVYSAAGHPPNKIWLHCVVCTHFVCTLISNNEGNFEYGGLEK